MVTHRPHLGWFLANIPRKAIYPLLFQHRWASSVFPNCQATCLPLSLIAPHAPPLTFPPLAPRVGLHWFPCQTSLVPLPEYTGSCQLSLVPTPDSWFLPDFTGSCQSSLVYCTGLNWFLPDFTGSCQTPLVPARHYWFLCQAFKKDGKYVTDNPALTTARSEWNRTGLPRA